MSGWKLSTDQYIPDVDSRYPIFSDMPGSEFASSDYPPAPPMPVDSFEGKYLAEQQYIPGDTQGAWSDVRPKPLYIPHSQAHALRTRTVAQREDDMMEHLACGHCGALGICGGCGSCGSCGRRGVAVNIHSVTISTAKCAACNAAAAMRALGEHKIICFVLLLIVIVVVACFAKGGIKVAAGEYIGRHDSYGGLDDMYRTADIDE